MVYLDGDRAVIDVSAGIEVRTDLDGVEVDLTSYARLIYRTERTASTWRIVSLDPVYERDTIAPAVPDTLVHVDPTDLAPYRPPYRLLAHTLALLGYEVAHDLYGDDQPDPVETLYRTAFTWLHAEPRPE